jgi:hypothetical protein
MNGDSHLFLPPAPVFSIVAVGLAAIGRHDISGHVAQP